MKRLIVLTAVLWGVFARAEPSPPDPIESWGHRVDYPLTAYREAPESFYERQAKITCDQALAALRRNPPATVPSSERLLAFLVLDHLFHDDPHAAARKAVQELYHQQSLSVLHQLEAEPSVTAPTLWKIYNHGFILRTRTSTIALDLTRAESTYVPGFFLPVETMLGLVHQCDVLFVSHRHPDHADVEVATEFLREHKPVVAADDIWLDKPFYRQLTHLPRVAEHGQPLPIRGGSQALMVYCYPGHQTVVPNDVFLVSTPEGFTFCHTGDQNWKPDDFWMRNVAAHHRLDLLLPNCWSPDIYRMLTGMHPALVVTGHENELGHEIFYRQTNWMTRDILEAGATPYVQLMWGEHFVIDSKADARIRP